MSVKRKAVEQVRHAVAAEPCRYPRTVHYMEVQVWLGGQPGVSDETQDLSAAHLFAGIDSDTALR